ncbi:MAG: hypothetical protein U0987_08330, partial [Afipia sp.]|nr:hypothetical protein [Afipia sp.]
PNRVVRLSSQTLYSFEPNPQFGLTWELSPQHTLRAAIIRSLPSHGISVLVIEHHMGLIMEVCDRIVVLNFGQKIAEGTPAEIRNNQAVIDAYLGHRDHA